MSQEINTVFCHNGKEYHFDVRDADDMARFENAIQTLQLREKEAPKTGKASELLRSNANMIKEFFDGCLGAGTGDAICGEQSNAGLCYNAYMEFLNLIDQQKDSIVADSNAIRQYNSERALRGRK